MPHRPEDLFMYAALVVCAVLVGLWMRWLTLRYIDGARYSRPTLAFDITDAPMLMHAMMIAGNTARMCGHPQAEERLREFQAFFEALSPIEAGYFDEETWGEMGMALQKAETFRVFLDEDSHDKRRRAEGRGRWSKNWQLYVEIGAKVFWARGLRYSLKPHESLKAGDPRVKAVYDVLDSLAPKHVRRAFDDQGVTEAA